MRQGGSSRLAWRMSAATTPRRSNSPMNACFCRSSSFLGSEIAAQYRSSRGSLGVRIRVDRNSRACRSVRKQRSRIGFKADKRPAVLQLFRAIARALCAPAPQGFIVEWLGHATLFLSERQAVRVLKRLAARQGAYKAGPKPRFQRRPALTRDKHDQYSKESEDDGDNGRSRPEHARPRARSG